MTQLRGSRRIWAISAALPWRPCAAGRAGPRSARSRVLVKIGDDWYWLYILICLDWPEWVARALREGTQFVIISALNVGDIFYMPMCAAAHDVPVPDVIRAEARGGPEAPLVVGGVCEMSEDAI